MNRVFEIVGEPQVGKTSLAVWLSQVVSFGGRQVIWIVAPQEDTSGLWQALDYQPAAALQAETVADAFEMASLASQAASLVVLDSLSGLRASHPQGHHIGKDVTRALARLDLASPFLVINQKRYPARAGGARWKALVQSLEMTKYRERPALYTRLGTGPEWLIWWPDEGLEVRALAEADKLWLPGSVNRCRFKESANRQEVVENGNDDIGGPGARYNRAWFSGVVSGSFGGNSPPNQL